MSKKIVSIGFVLASDDVEFVSIESKTSLLDWDIVLFQPDIQEEFVDHYSDGRFQGKPSLSTTGSFRLKEVLAHWRREMREAVDAGKTVVVFMSELTEVYVDTGSRTYSGTGKNQKTTTHVELCSNYEAIPLSLKPLATQGNAMKLAPKDAEVLAPYWKDFESVSSYEVLLSETQTPPAIVTKYGDKVVGLVGRSKSSQGSLLLLPHIDFSPDHFYEGEDLDFSEAAVQFAARLVSSVVAIDRALRAGGEATPEPAWASAAVFELASEASLKEQLLEVERRLEEAQKDKELVAESLTSVGTYRALLFEKGRPLELALVDALGILGFSASNFKDSNSEFDVVFESPEGRLVGEAEGKDGKAVNIDKLRQLSMNIHEDLQREEVSVPAKPVLFGNGFRLVPLEERADPFTGKCHTAARSSSTALVFTPDLFRVVQYLLAHPDPDFARLCRCALVEGVGRIEFPAVPATDVSSQAKVSVA